MKKIVLVIALFTWVSFSINAQTKMSIEPSKLPKEILDNMTMQHKDCKILKAESLNEKGMLTYIVQAECNKEKMKFIYDKDKKFVKEEMMKSEVKKASTKTSEMNMKKTEPKKAEPKKQEPKAKTSM